MLKNAGNKKAALALSLISFFGGGEAVAKVAPEEFNLSPLHEIINEGDRGSVLSAKAKNGSPTIKPAETLSFYVVPDLAKGRVLVSYPVAAAPGANDLTPDVKLVFGKWQGSRIQRGSAELSGLEKITACEAASSGFCLGEIPIKTFTEKGKVRNYYIPQMAGVRILKTATGWQFQSLKGITKNYTQRADAGAGLLSRVSDRRGNFINYTYNDQSQIAEITYGAAGSSAKGQKSLSFEYDEGSTADLIEVTSKVAGRSFSKVYLSYDPQGYPGSLRNCAVVSGRAEKEICRPEYGLQWDTGGYLETVKIGNPLRMSFKYQNTKEGKKLISRKVVLKNEIVEKQKFEYEGQEIRILNELNKSGVYQIFGGALHEDVAVSEGRLTFEHLGRRYVKSTTTTREFGLVETAYGDLSVLKSVTTNGRVSGKYAYDHYGRLSSITTGGQTQTLTYLHNEGDVFSKSGGADLVSKMTDTNSRGDITSDLEYEFENGQVTARDLLVRSNDNVMSEFSWKYDRFGNVISYQENNGPLFETTYESVFNTYPSSQKVTHENHVETSILGFDPKTGTQIFAKYGDGSHETVTLNPFGDVINRAQKSVDPVARGTDQAIVDVEESIDYQLLPNGNTQQQFEKVFRANDQQYQTSLVTKVTDPLGRLVTFHTREKNHKNEVTRDTEMTQVFDKGMRSLQMKQDGKLLQKIRINQQGQLVYEKSGDYGAVSYQYDDKGRVIKASRGGREILLAYDIQDRLVQKTLPNGRVYKLSYDKNFPLKIAKAVLPSGKELRFQYGKDGLLATRDVILPHPLRKGETLKFTEQMTYENDQLNTVTFANGSKLGYQYEKGQIKAINWVENQHSEWSLPGNAIATYSANTTAEGAQLAKILGNGLTEKIKWDLDGRISSIDVGRSPSDKLFEQSYETEGGLIKKETFTGSSFHKMVSYEYDTDKRLTGWSDKTGDMDYPQVEALKKNIDELEKDVFGNIAETELPGSFSKYAHEFDVENKLIRSWNNRSEISYDYDHMGGRLEKSVSGGERVFYISPFYHLTFETNGRVRESLFVWDHMGRIAKFERYLSDEDLNAFVVVGASGRIWQEFETVGRSLFFKAAQNPGTTLFTLMFLVALCFCYAERRLPVFVTSENAKIAFSKQAITCLTVTAFSVSILSPTAAVLASEKGEPQSSITFFHRDVRGSVIMTSNRAGEQHGAQAYNPYGLVQTAPNDTAKDARFAGMTYDGETGLYYVGARYYDPVRGVFLSPDPKRASVNPYEYADGNPVNLIDHDGRMPHEPVALELQEHVAIEMPASLPFGTASEAEDLAAVEGRAVAYDQRSEASSPNGTASAGETRSDLDWARYPTFGHLTFGYTEGLSVPEEEGPIPDYTSDDEREYNEHVRGGYMQGWTRLGGFTQALGSALLLTFFNASQYEYDDGSVGHAGFIRDFVSNFLLLLTFIGFSYGYSGNEADYWAGVQRREATERDYWVVSARRMAWKMSFQLATFPLLFMASNAVRGYPLINEENPHAEDYGNYVGYTMLRLLPYSLIGNMALLPFFALFKEPSVGFDDGMTEEGLSEYGLIKRQLVKFGIAYRNFANRKGFWEQSFEPGSFDHRLQYSWYWLNMLQLHFWFAIGSSGYYGGMGTMVGVVPGFTEEKFLRLWRANAILLSLCPPVSLLNGVNYWHRKSYTIVKKRSLQNPRKEGVLYRILGPIEGLRIAKFDDTSYLDARDWYSKLEQLREVLSDRATIGGSLPPPEEHLGGPNTGEPAP